MIYNDRYLFVALPRCASSFVIVHLVEQHGWSHVDPRPLPSWNHRPICTAPESVRAGRVPFAVVRDPWSFYRSLYRYPRHWEENEPDGFNAWLRLLLDGIQHRHYRLFQKLDCDLWSVLARWDIGLLTFNLVLQCAEDPRGFLARREAPEHVELAVKLFLSQGALRAQLGSLLDLSDLSSVPDRNVSTAPIEPYQPDTLALVTRKERLICERFGFVEPPCGVMP